MSGDDLDDIEVRLSVALPSEYRDVMLHYPAELRNAFAGWKLNDSPSFAINETLHQRLSGVDGENRLPNGFLVIGSDAGGDHYYLNLTQEPAAIVRFDHESGMFSEVAWSVQGWCKVLLKEAREERLFPKKPSV